MWNVREFEEDWKWKKWNKQTKQEKQNEYNSEIIDKFDTGKKY